MTGWVHDARARSFVLLEAGLVLVVIWCGEDGAEWWWTVTRKADVEVAAEPIAAGPAPTWTAGMAAALAAAIDSPVAAAL